MKKKFEEQLTFIQAVVDLFYPFVEGALHDLESGTIAALYNNFSQRKVGDQSPLSELNISIEQFPDYFPPYYKTNWDGKKLKCISITIRDKNKKPIGLMCFNLDVQVFQDVENKLSLLLQLKQGRENPIELFGEKWQEQIHRHLELYLKKHRLSITRLTKKQKIKLVQFLYKKGVFHFKNAAPFIAETLGISRASLYNYMKGSHA